MNSGSSYSAAVRGGFSAGSTKSGSRVKAGSIKRHSDGSHLITKMSSDQCVEEIKHAFKSSASIEANKEPLSANAINEQCISENEEDDITQASPTKTTSKKKPLGKLILCTHAVRYNVIKRVCRKMEFKLNEDVTIDWDLYWSDTGVQPEQISKLRPYQRINCQPGMQALARKNNLARNLIRMQKAYKDEFSFFPKTWVLPSDQNDFKAQFNKKKAKTFIIKPVNMCQGRGIYLTRRFEEVDLKSGDQLVAQRYMARPYLIDDLKFDLRIYVLVYGVDPLRIFVFKEGLARFATEAYTGPAKANLDNLYMHLTNYAINKNATNFVKNTDIDDDAGTKRTLTTVLDHIEAQEPNFSRENMLDQIEDICVKTIIAVQPALSHAYRTSQPDDLENSTCFQILGMDIMIDQKLKPWMIEVNHLSSFGTDSPLDKRVKFDLIWDTFNLLNLSLKRKKKTKKERADQFSRRMHKEAPLTKHQKEEIRQNNMRERDNYDCNNLGGFRRSFPNPNCDLQTKYEFLLEESKALWNEFTNGVKPHEQVASSFNYNNFAGSSSFNNSKTNPIGNNKAKALDLGSPNPKQQPTFLNRMNNQYYQNNRVNDLQQPPQLSKLSSSNSNTIQMTASTAAGATASSSSSHNNKPALNSSNQTTPNPANVEPVVTTPMSRGQRAQRQDSQQLTNGIKPPQASHLIFVDGDQGVDGNGYSYVERKHNDSNKRAMTLTEPPIRHQTETKKTSAAYRNMVEPVSHDQRRYQNMQQQRMMAEQMRNSSLQKKFPMIKLDAHSDQYQNEQRLQYVKMHSEEPAKVANPKCPLHGSAGHHHHHHMQVAAAVPVQQQPPIFHKGSQHEVNYIIQQSMRAQQAQQAQNNRLAKSPMQTKQHILSNSIEGAGSVAYPMSHQKKDQKSVRLSGSIRDTKNVRNKSETWENAHQTKHANSLRTTSSRTNIIQQSGVGKSAALQNFEQKILLTKQQMNGDASLMIASPSKPAVGASNGKHMSAQRQNRSMIANGRSTIPTVFHPQVQSAETGNSERDLHNERAEEDDRYQREREDLKPESPHQSLQVERICSANDALIKPKPPITNTNNATTILNNEPIQSTNLPVEAYQITPQERVSCQCTSTQMQARKLKKRVLMVDQDLDYHDLYSQTIDYERNLGLQQLSHVSPEESKRKGKKGAQQQIQSVKNATSLNKAQNWSQISQGSANKARKLRSSSKSIRKPLYTKTSVQIQSLEPTAIQFRTRSSTYQLPKNLPLQQTLMVFGASAAKQASLQPPSGFVVHKRCVTSLVGTPLLTQQRTIPEKLRMLHWA